MDEDYSQDFDSYSQSMLSRTNPNKNKGAGSISDYSDSYRSISQSYRKWFYIPLNQMAIFGKEPSKNKVYYRRKSLRLNNYATALATGITFCTAIYFIMNRNKHKDENIDEISTGTLRLQ